MTQLSPGLELIEKDLSAYISRAATGRGATVGKFQWGPAFEIMQITDESDAFNRLGGPDDYTYGSYFSVLNFLKYANDCRTVRIVGDDSLNSSPEYAPVLNIGAPGATYLAADKIFAVYDVSWTRASAGATVATIQFPNNKATSGELISIKTSSVPGIIPVAPGVVISSVTQDTITIPCTAGASLSGTVTLYFEAAHIATVATVGSSPTGKILTTTLNTAAIKTAVINGRILVGSNVTYFASSVAGTGATFTFAINPLSTIYFPNIDQADLAMAESVHVAAMTAQGLPSVYGKFPGAYGDDIEVTLISYADFIDSAVTTIPKVPAGGTVAKVTSIYGVAGPQTADQWAISVAYKGEVVETFIGSTKAGDKDIYGRTIYIPDLFIAGVSKYIMASIDAPWTSSMHLVLGAGDDSTATPGDWITGWDLFSDPDTIYVNLIFAGGACNENDDDSKLIQQAIMDDVANVRRDCLAFLSPSINSTTRLAAADAAANAVKYRNGTAPYSGSLGGSSFGEADTGQHKFQYDKYNDKKRWVALNADIAGLCAFTDRVAAPWNSPAGLNRGAIKGVIKLAYDAKKSLRDTLYEAQLNPVIFFPAEGYCLFGDKTLQNKPSAFDRINVRRLFNLLEKAIGDASKYKLFENNTPFTRNSFVTQVSAYLDTIRSQSGIVDYFVWCDERNNTPEVIDRNEFVGTIFIKAPRSINYLQLNFVATSTGANFEELIAQNF